MTRTPEGAAGVLSPEGPIQKTGEAGLISLPKGDPDKLRIALRLRQETTMTLAWVAQRLHMGTRTHLAHLLYWRERDKKKKPRERR
jgi:hypothetical protein